MVARETGSSYHLGSSRLLEAITMDCYYPPYVMERHSGNPPYIVGGYVYDREIRPSSAGDSLARVTGNTSPHMAGATNTSAVAVDPSSIAMAGHCGCSSDDWAFPQEDL